MNHLRGVSTVRFLLVLLSSWLVAACAEPDEEPDGPTDWVVDSNPSPLDDFLWDLALDDSGLYLAGSDLQFGREDEQWRIEKRSLDTGELLWLQTNNLGYGLDGAEAVATDDTGVYIVGYGSAGSWRVEKRRLEDGQSIWIKFDDPGASADALDVVVHEEALFVAGWENVTTEGNVQRLEKRSRETGEIEWQRIEQTTGWHGSWRSVMADKEVVYVAGTERENSCGRWRIEKRSASDGETIWSRVGECSPYGNNSATIAFAENEQLFVYVSIPDDELHLRSQCERWDPSDGAQLQVVPKYIDDWKISRLVWSRETVWVKGTQENTVRLGAMGPSDTEVQWIRDLDAVLMEGWGYNGRAYHENSLFLAGIFDQNGQSTDAPTDHGWRIIRLLLPPEPPQSGAL